MIMDNYKNVSNIKVIVTSEEYSLIDTVTRCRLGVTLWVSPDITDEFFVTSYARLKDGDSFDEAKGRRIARAKATTRAYNVASKRLYRLDATLWDMMISIRKFLWKSMEVERLNREYIKR